MAASASVPGQSFSEKHKEEINQLAKFSREFKSPKQVEENKKLLKDINQFINFGDVLLKAYPKAMVKLVVEIEANLKKIDAKVSPLKESTLQAVSNMRAYIEKTQLEQTKDQYVEPQISPTGKALSERWRERSLSRSRTRLNAEFKNWEPDLQSHFKTIFDNFKTRNESAIKEAKLLFNLIRMELKFLENLPTPNEFDEKAKNKAIKFIAMELKRKFLSLPSVIEPEKFSFRCIKMLRETTQDIWFRLFRIRERVFKGQGISQTSTYGDTGSKLYELLHQNAYLLDQYGFPSEDRRYATRPEKLMEPLMSPSEREQSPARRSKSREPVARSPLSLVRAVSITQSLLGSLRSRSKTPSRAQSPFSAWDGRDHSPLSEGSTEHKEKLVRSRSTGPEHPKLSAMAKIKIALTQNRKPPEQDRTPLLAFSAGHSESAAVTQHSDDHPETKLTPTVKIPGLVSRDSSDTLPSSEAITSPSRRRGRSKERTRKSKKSTEVFNFESLSQAASGAVTASPTLTTEEPSSTQSPPEPLVSPKRRARSKHKRKDAVGSRKAFLATSHAHIRIEGVQTPSGSPSHSETPTPSGTQTPSGAQTPSRAQTPSISLTPSTSSAPSQSQSTEPRASQRESESKDRDQGQSSSHATIRSASLTRSTYVIDAAGEPQIDMGPKLNCAQLEIIEDLLEKQIIALVDKAFTRSKSKDRALTTPRSPQMLYGKRPLGFVTTEGQDEASQQRATVDADSVSTPLITV